MDRDGVRLIFTNAERQTGLPYELDVLNAEFALEKILIGQVALQVEWEEIQATDPPLPEDAASTFSLKQECFDLGETALKLEKIMYECSRSPEQFLQAYERIAELRSTAKSGQPKQ